MFSRHQSILLGCCFFVAPLVKPLADWMAAGRVLTPEIVTGLLLSGLSAACMAVIAYFTTSPKTVKATSLADDPTLPLNLTPNPTIPSSAPQSAAGTRQAPAGAGDNP